MSDDLDKGPMVTVPRDALLLLYQCALSYDVRIPTDNGGEWAWVFHDMFAGDNREGETQCHE